MFNFGFSEILVLLGLALIFIGPKQLPEVARTVGRLLNELRRSTSEFTGSLMETRDSTRKIFEETKSQISDDLKVDLSLGKKKADNGMYYVSPEDEDTLTHEQASSSEPEASSGGERPEEDTQKQDQELAAAPSLDSQEDGSGPLENEDNLANQGENDDKRG